MQNKGDGYYFVQIDSQKCDGRELLSKRILLRIRITNATQQKHYIEKQEQIKKSISMVEM